ncbi:MAG TPA: acireductone synthase [Pyrinomonadaceae bacterium]|jgi:enolase-phosphatase E1
MISSSLPSVTKAILLDIEGTTTPIAFVHEVLFSYARSHVAEFLTAHFGAEDVTADLALLRAEHAGDLKQGLMPPALATGTREAEINSLVAYVNWLIDQDRKSPGLKSLQGKIWKQGYVDGVLKSQVFADVAPAFERWRRAGLQLSIFSSGSVLAQKLLFAHTEAGDLTSFIDSYFDTTVGSKTDVQSYRQMTAALSLTASQVLFISDVVNELAAASDAGMQTLLCVRPGNQPQSLTDTYHMIHSFAEISG